MPRDAEPGWLGESALDSIRQVIWWKRWNKPLAALVFIFYGTRKDSSVGLGNQRTLKGPFEE